ncbi:MAG: F0F1 ATP synthase subunit B' [Paracoccus sp. (in: a-proteobacteria)]|uniref:F0F1 ATP synthase subunit B' n=1 Tax=Paracoccus sp. TaxID=267 RepID=UPI0026DECD26|nr:F0F1 ATP synthase subunit B' [Paracoccus sp. (in: a-proteobacteria)]MDO5621538.1 F0F1 ATP synthase subunit B' [Paracoccus sp. (in: a-proteobacteria)]
MFSLLQQTAPVVVETIEENTVVVPEAAHGTVEVAHGAAAAAESSTGMPQLDFSTFGNQIFWLLVTLAVLYWVLSRIALPRIASVISDRQAAVTGDLMAAEEFKRKAQEAEAAYEDALTQARSEAGKIVEANRAAIQKDLDAAIAKADAEIAARGLESEKRIADIRASSRADAATVAKDVTADLLAAFGGQADAGAINAAVDAKLKGAA